MKQTIWSALGKKKMTAILMQVDASLAKALGQPNGKVPCGHRSTLDDVPLVEFMYLLFIHMPGKSYRRWLRS